MAGHPGIKKTESRFMVHFYWPKLHKDVVEYCRSCHTCQVVGKPQYYIKPAPLVPAFEESFTSVLIDCVGPLPRTKTGHKYLLTMMEDTTRFPEAIPLKNITTKVIVEALVQFSLDMDYLERYNLIRQLHDKTIQGSNGTIRK